MTEQEVEYHVETMLKMWPHLPNPEHEPRRFKHYVKLYKHLMKLKGYTI